MAAPVSPASSAAPASPAATPRDPAVDARLVADLSALLQESLKALAAAGEADAACRLGGRACAALRERDMKEWRRFNALLHRLSPKADPFGPA